MIPSPRPPAVHLAASLLAALLALAAPVGAADEQEGRQYLVTERGIGVAELDGRRIDLPYSLTRIGPLVALQPLVAALGGELEVGPLGQSHTLRLQQVEALFGADSSALVIDDSIVRLAPEPAAGVGGLHVPLALLRRTYGDALRYDFSWDEAGRTLTASQRPAHELELSLETVHLQGVTTLVLRFSAPPHYRIERRPGRIVVDAGADRLRPVALREPPAGSWVRGVEVGEHRVEIELAAGAKVEDYTLEDPFRLVFDVHRGSPGADVVDLDRKPPVRDPGIRTIVLDPGHGGRETGALGADGVAEKDLVLRLARSLQNRLEQRLPVRVVLTRNDDQDLPLETRTALANQHKADLFVSLHLNSSTGDSARGAETYFLSLQASDARAAEVAETENLAAHRAEEAADGAGSGGELGADPLYDLQLMLWDLAQSRHLAESQRLATLIQEELNRELGLRDRGVKQAPFAVLRGAAMPAVLVELGFLSNPVEEALLVTPEYRAQLVDALVRAVTRYKAQVEDAGGALGAGR